VLPVEVDLDLAPSLRLADRLLHRVGDLVRVHDHGPVDVARRPADRLDQRRVRTQEALLVGVEDRDQRDLGQVETLAQEVDPDQHVELAEAQVADDLDALDRVDLRVQVPDPDPHLEQVVREVLGHLLGQCRDEHPLAGLGALADLLDQVVHLAAGGPDLDLGVDEPVGRTICSAMRLEVRSS
jgi:hypothetical protein